MRGGRVRVVLGEAEAGVHMVQKQTDKSIFKKESARCARDPDSEGEKGWTAFSESSSRKTP